MPRPSPGAPTPNRDPAGLERVAINNVSISPSPVRLTDMVLGRPKTVLAHWPADRDSLLTDRQRARLAELFADRRNTIAEVTWAVYQQMIDAYQDDDPRRARGLLASLIDSIAPASQAAWTRSPDSAEP